MIQKLFANTLARKASVFAIVFVAAILLMGTWMTDVPGQYAAEVSVQASVMHAEAPTIRLADPIPAADPPEVADPQIGALVAAEPDESGQADATEALPTDYTPPAEWTGTVAEDFRYLPELPLSEELQRYTYAKCEEQGIEYTLVLALMWRESGFETQAVGYNKNGTSDSGIMQINDINREWLHRELAIDNLLDPYQNIDAGTEILGRFTEKYGAHGALMAYQYGEGGMRKKLAEGVTTNDQIEKLYEKQAEFDEMYAAAD